MRIITSLADLPERKRLAVIINCGTKWVSTLALASVRAATDMPILLIDCASKDGSFAHFSALAQRHRLPFFWLDWPLRKHGDALDALFREVLVEEVLLVDSDAEIREPHVLSAMLETLSADPQAYGAGFLHGPEWLGQVNGLPERIGYFAARMWIPFVLLRGAAVRAALAHGASFIQRRAFVEFGGRPNLSRWLATRFWIPGLRGIGLASRVGEPSRPAFIEFDTGADMHRMLGELGYRFAGLPPDLWQGIHHYHGVSRSALAWTRRKFAQRLGLVAMANDTSQNAIIDEVRLRLADRYSIDADAGGTFGKI
jgi:hypothetical protein